MCKLTRAANQTHLTSPECDAAVARRGLHAVLQECRLKLAACSLRCCLPPKLTAANCCRQTFGAVCTFI